MRRCLGDENVVCSPRSSIETSSTNTDRRNQRQPRSPNDPLDTIDSMSIKRSSSVNQIKTKKNDEYDYDLVFDLENGGVHQLRIAHPLTNRQLSDELGDPGRNWRSNMMRVWGRRWRRSAA